jgi:hypothetical protein
MYRTAVMSDSSGDTRSLGRFFVFCMLPLLFLPLFPLLVLLLALEWLAVHVPFGSLRPWIGCWVAFLVFRLFLCPPLSLPLSSILL